jgi:hypothetical protein
MHARLQANLDGFQQAEARDIRKAVTLNLAACYLSLGQHRDCIRQCDEALKGGRPAARGG